MSSQSKCLCIIPWLHRYTDEQGWQRACFAGADDGNLLHDAQGKPIHVTQNYTDEEILNSPDLKAIRLAMLRGEWPTHCAGCRWSEEAGGTSHRHHMNHRFEHVSASLLSRTAEDGTLDRPQVHFVDIRMGNACNLTCRMCGPSASRPWVEHYNEVQPKRFALPLAQLEVYRDGNWVKRQSVEKLIEQCLPTLESLHFAGGEPLIVPETIDALELCVRSGRANQIELSFNTNITVLPERVTRLWPHFRNVTLLCSIDGRGVLNEYIRHPSKWKDVDRNIRLLDRQFEEWKLKSVFLSATVQVYNVLQLDELFDYLATGFERVTRVPLLYPLHFPSYLSIQILPPRLKAIARERLLAERAKAMARLPEKWHYILGRLDATIAFMDAGCPPMQLVEFLYFSEKSDREFGGSWRQACPELARLLRSQDQGVVP